MLLHLGVKNNFMFPACKNSQKQVKIQKSTDMQSFVIWWHNSRKYRSVWYLLSCTPELFFVNFISGLTGFWTFVRNETYLESSIKMRSFLSQWMAAFGSEATKQANCKGSPSIKATSFGFSRKNGTTPSMTSFSMVSCNDFYIELIKTVEIFLQGSKYFWLNKGIIIRTGVKLFGWIVLPHLTIPLYDY